MPKKSNQKRILTMHSFLSLGMGVIGIFWPFMLGEKFDMSPDGIILMMGLFWLFTALWVWPCAKGAELLGDKKKILPFSMLLLIISYSLVLGIDSFPSYYYLGMLLFFYSSHLMLYWPLFHQATAQSTENEGIGTFLGNFQTITIAAGVLGPIVAGYFLDKDDLFWLILGGNFFLIIALFVASQLKTTHSKVSSLGTYWETVKMIPSQKFFPGILIDGVHDITLSILWIIVLQEVSGSFLVTGSIIALAVLVEIFTSQIWGRLMDRYKSANLIWWAMGARFIDISSRGLLLVFPLTSVAIGLQLLGAFLGPVFQNTIGGRFYDNALKSKYLADFLISYEFYLCLSRAVTLLISYGFYQLWGINSLAIFLFLGGILSFGFRRY